MKAMIIKMKIKNAWNHFKMWTVVKLGNPTNDDWVAYALYTKEGRRMLGDAMIGGVQGRMAERLKAIDC